MPTIKFPCPHCGQGELEARLGTVEQFSPPEVNDLRAWAEITRRRQEYIGAQVMGAIMVHAIYEGCPAMPLEDCDAEQPWSWSVPWKAPRYRCNRAKGHDGDHELQCDHPSGVRVLASWHQAPKLVR